MGFVTVPECSLDLEMPQLPRNIYRVRVLADYTQPELAEATGISAIDLITAEGGGDLLPHSDWKKVLDVCGRRAFDYDPE